MAERDAAQPQIAGSSCLELVGRERRNGRPRRSSYVHYRLAEVAQVAARYLDQRDALEPVGLAELPKRREVVASCGPRR